MDRDLLREFVNEALNEAPMDPAKSAKQGLGLISYDKGDKKSLVLFNVKQAAELAYSAAKAGKTSDEIMDAVEPSIVGFIFGKKPAEPSWGALTITASAATKGYGPLMYDIAMDKWGKIMPDRRHVSPAAERVWVYYAKNRNDVERLQLDDIEDPKTPSPQDDAKINKGDDLDGPLNGAYQGAKVDSGALEAAGHKFLLWAKASGLDVTKIKNALHYAGSGFFRRHYLDA